jgi:uncharacterized protein YcbK (DUF882 family)
MFVAVFCTSRRDAEASRPMSYREMVRSWHDAPPLSTRPDTPEGRPALVLEMINTHERIELAPQRDDGGFSDADLERATQALRDHKSGVARPFDPRMLDLVYRIERHFDAPLVRIVSAYRRGRHSNHSRARAIDLVVPGVKDAEVAKFARSVGFVGVGLYTQSGFVHIDSRAKSYFWVDGSGPGRRGRIVQVYAKLAADADAQALARGETPPDSDANREHASQTAGGTTFTSTVPRTAPAAVDDNGR